MGVKFLALRHKLTGGFPTHADPFFALATTSTNNGCRASARAILGMGGSKTEDDLQRKCCQMCAVGRMQSGRC